MILFDSILLLSGSSAIRNSIIMTTTTIAITTMVMNVVQNLIVTVVTDAWLDYIVIISMKVITKGILNRVVVKMMDVSATILNY